MISPIPSAARGKPAWAIRKTHKGENSTPPRLAPLYAMLSAAGRRRANHGAISALTAAGPSATQPPPLTSAAPYNCQGACASDQPHTPSASSTAPVAVVANADASIDAGRLATTAAPVKVQRHRAGHQREAPAAALRDRVQEHRGP